MNQVLLDYIISHKHHEFRKEFTEINDISEEYRRQGLSPKERMTRRFELLTTLETPIFLPEERICYMRTVKNMPDCFTKEEWAQIRREHFIHEKGYLSNLSPNYEKAIRRGLMSLRDEADEYGKRMIDAVFSLSDRYCREAEKQGRKETAEALAHIPRQGARNFFEALQFFRILHFSLWLEGNYHVTVGRFDQYMYPYLKADMEKGIYTEETALELLEDFFISFNKDSDLYVGVQQGDNGQSMVLGGTDEEKEARFNLLSALCLRASRELMLIDPKINLRVNRDTPLEVFELGSELTKAGLGFPQYSNDDVVIDGLLKLGYEPEDARNYVVAACWEFIIPYNGADVANIGALSFPMVIDSCLHEDLYRSETFEEFLEAVRKRIVYECDQICDKIKDIWFVPSPLMNVMMDGGIYDGGKYNNFGLHGTGIATAVDSLAAIRKYVYEEKRISREELIQAVDTNYENHPTLLALLRNEAPKLGNDEESTNELLERLLGMFSDALEGRVNCRGGKYRAGTGTAMYYLWHANEMGASPDGRRKGEPFGTNFSPSLMTKIKGPFSVIKSFSRPDFTRAVNGGPLTLEFAASMFHGEDDVKKIAALVKAYITMGGHQLQLNAVDTEKMKDAQLHPENYRQLVVRIWGWSAYFVELDRDFQDHVIMRQQYNV
ncbi:pyruvate formate lyase family protein [Acetatifactor muris]|uniref:pyruvate formate lyase family protein n=1 Tax=Acetatifactor muris TaxID=879566 RepID=UPI0023F0BE27|nr:pyruvate formate lyase family protein [Acetatifactor muris]